MRSLILFHSSLSFFSVSLLSSVGTNVRYLFPLLSSIYPFILFRIKWKLFTLLIVYVAKVFDYNVSNVINKITFVWFFIYLDLILEQDSVYWYVIQKVVCMTVWMVYDINFNLLFIFSLCYWYSNMVINVFVLINFFYEVTVNTNNYH